MTFMTSNSAQPEAAGSKFHLTMAELEATARIPGEDQMTTASQDREPATIDWQRDLIEP